MGLLSIFQRKKQTAAQPAKATRSAKGPARQAPSANAAETAEAVRDARARARRRLMGATVLLLLGVIGFPLLFETQPRPIPVDLPIEIPSRNATAGFDAPPARGRGAPATRPTTPSPATESVSYDARQSPASTPAALPASAGQLSGRPSGFASLAAALTPGALRGGAPAASAAASAGPATSVAQAAAYAKPKAPKPPATPASAQAVAAPVPASLAHVLPTLPPAPATASGPSATAAALLASKPATRPSEAAADANRFVVQVGAFADDAKLREARGKVEKLGLKTYTQAVETPGGKRVRVRVGPFPTKTDADRAAAKIKADGLPAAVLAL